MESPSMNEVNFLNTIVEKLKYIDQHTKEFLKIGNYPPIADVFQVYATARRFREELPKYQHICPKYDLRIEQADGYIKLLELATRNAAGIKVLREAYNEQVQNSEHKSKKQKKEE